MIFPVIRSANKPNRLTDTKDLEYHTEYGRYVLKCSNNPVTLTNISKYIVNYNFYKDNQWIYNEDLETFLKDESGDVRNRIRWEYNIIKAMVEQYVGNVIKSDFSVRAYNSSPFAAERKQAGLVERLQAHQLADAMPLAKEHLTQKYNLGETPQKTEQQYNTEYEDYSEVAINGLIRHEENINKFAYQKVMLAFNMAIGGACFIKEREQDGEQYWDTIDNAYHFFDTGAKMPDLSDAEYMGDYGMYYVTEILEKAPQLTKAQRESLEDFSLFRAKMPAVDDYSKMFGNAMGRIPVYDIYWHDTEPMEFGYIKDQYGYKYLAKIDDDPESKYNRKNVIPYKDLTTYEKKDVEANGIILRFKDVIRFVNFVPAELVDASEDIVLDWGLLKHSETYTNAPFESMMPYKCATYKYKYGEIISPIDPVIKPQRIINRCVSMAESLLNNSRGSNYFVDKSLLSGSAGGEAGMQRDMNQSKPVIVDGTRYGGNIQNAVREYNATGLRDAGVFMTLIEGFRNMAQNVTGLSDNMIGLGTGSKQLVGVQQSNIARGTLLQEGFYNSISNLFEQVYSCIANKGRMIYAENDRKLALILGDEGLKVIQFTKDMMLEEFRVELRRVSPDEVSIETNNQLLMSLLQGGLIGEQQFALLFNRAETDMVAHAVREYSVQKAQMAQEQQQQQQQAQMQQQQQLEQQMQFQQAQEQHKEDFTASENEKERQNKLNLKQMQEMGKLVGNQMKNNET